VASKIILLDTAGLDFQRVLPETLLLKGAEQKSCQTNSRPYVNMANGYHVRLNGVESVKIHENDFLRFVEKTGNISEGKKREF
jgi:hypothetical protein